MCRGKEKTAYGLIAVQVISIHRQLRELIGVYEAHRKQLEESDSGWQFSHTLTEQIGGQLRADFTLTGFYEDTNGEGRLHELHIPSFIATRAVK